MNSDAQTPQPMHPNEILTRAAILEEKELIAQKIVAEVPMVIETVEHYTSALQYLRMIKDRQKEIEEFRELLMRPLLDATTKLRERFKKFTDPLEMARADLDRRISKFREAEADRVRIAQEEENKKAIEAVLKITEEGGDVTQIAIPEEVKSVMSQAPDLGIGFQKVWRYWMDYDCAINSTLNKWPRITRENSNTLEIPNKYWVLDFAAVGKDIRAGKTVPGFSAKQEEVSKNK